MIDLAAIVLIGIGLVLGQLAHAWFAGWNEERKWRKLIKENIHER